MSTSSYTKEDRFDSAYLAIANNCDGLDEIFDSFFSFLRRKTDTFSPPGGISQLKEKMNEYIDYHYALKQKENSNLKKAVVNSTKKTDQSISSTAPITEKQEIKTMRSSNNISSIKNNGYTIDNLYSWTQTLSDVTISISLPTGMKKSDIKIQIKPTFLSIQLGPKVILQGKLYEKILGEDSTWLIDGNVVQVFLYKENSMKWWLNFVEGEPLLNLDTDILSQTSNINDLPKELHPLISQVSEENRKKVEEKEQQTTNLHQLHSFMNSHPELDFSGVKEDLKNL